LEITAVLAVLHNALCALLADARDGQKVLCCAAVEPLQKKALYILFDRRAQLDRGAIKRRKR
jgi:hypothetical protein